MSLKEDFVKQLHEQYAINNNAHLSSVISLMVAMLAVFYGFGYMFVYSSIYFSSDFKFVVGNGIYTLDAFVFTAMATNIVLSIMISVCLYQGFAGRYEQFITYAIRKKYGLIDDVDNQYSIFPSYYQPFFKQGLEIPQGLFGVFVKIFIGLAILIQLIVLIKFSQNIYEYHENEIHGVGVLYVAFYIVVSFFVYYRSYVLWIDKVKKYNSLQNEFKSKIFPNIDKSMSNVRLKSYAKLCYFKFR